MPEKLEKVNVDKVSPRNKFANSASLLAGGAAVGQIIIVVASPVLTRLYSPEDFGLLAVFTSLLGIIGVIASLRYQLAIPLPKNDTDAANVTTLSLLAVLFMTLLTSLIVIPFRDSISGVLNTPFLADFIWLVPLGVMASGFYEVLNYWAVRKKQFSKIAQTKLLQSTGMVTIQICAHAMGPIALLFGRVIGQAAGIFSLLRLLVAESTYFKNPNLRKIALCAKRYRSFPLISTWSALMNSLGALLPALLISVILGPLAAGLYALTTRVLALPVGVISKSIGDVFYSEASEASSSGRLGALVQDIYTKMVIASLPIAAVITIAAPDIFKFVFGTEWERSGEIASWLTISVFFQFVTTPAGRVFLILEKHGHALFFQLLFLISAVIAIFFGGLILGDIVSIVLILSSTRALVYCLRFWKILSLVNLRVFVLWRPIVRSLPYTLLCCGPSLIALHMLERPSENMMSTLAIISLSCLLAVCPCAKFLLKRNT